jgi:fucose permease
MGKMGYKKTIVTRLGGFIIPLAVFTTIAVIANI